MITERAPHPANHYEIERQKDSELIPGARISLDPWYNCPRCSAVVGDLPHDEPKYCHECLLNITRRGNMLLLSGEKPG